VFCHGCLLSWLERRGSCPSCQTGISLADVSELSSNPLLTRLLGRIRVKCSAPACAWRGENSELAAHLMSTDAHRSSSSGAAGVSTAAGDAEALKEAGNEKLRARQPLEAIKLYSKALSLNPNPTYLTNRAAAWLLVGAPKEAAADCRAALAMEPGNAKAHARLAKSLCESAEAEAALAHLQAVLPQLGQEEQAVLSEPLAVAHELSQLMRLGGSAAASGDWATACAAFEAARSHSGAPSLALQLARAELGRGNSDRAQRLTLGVLKGDNGCAEAFALRGEAFLQAGDFAQAGTNLREALRLAPDDATSASRFKAARRAGAACESAREAVMRRDFEAAVSEFSAALEAVALPPSAPLHTSLLTERGSAQLRLKAYDACLADVNAALAGSDDSRQNKQAYLTRASCLRQLGRPGEALESLKAALEMDPGDVRLKADADQCEFEARRAARPDYYFILNCGRTAGPSDVKVAYKRCAMECHPDRLGPEASPEQRAEAEERFKLCGEALEVLSEPMRKGLYDEGYDLKAINERVAAAERAAREHKRGGCANGGCGSGGSCG